MIAIDFLDDSDGDLKIENGDFIAGNSDNQHIADIIASFPGENKQFPLVGVGVMQYLNSTSRDQQLESSIKQQLESDGYQVNSISLMRDASGKIKISTDSIRVR